MASIEPARTAWVGPSQGEIDRAIDSILSAGLKKPRSLRFSLGEIRQLLGFRFVFWDTAQAFLLSVITLLGALLFIAVAPETFRHAVLFGCSPLLCVVILFFSETIERTGSLYELKLTCKYSIQRVVTYRIICFSLFGIASCVGVTAYQAPTAHELLRLLPLSLCALFLCMSLSLFFIQRLPGRWSFVLPALSWMALTVIPALVVRDIWELFLSGLPLAVTLGVALLAAALFLLEVKTFMNARQREAVRYAVG
jgi:hypothetical protein